MLGGSRINIYPNGNSLMNITFENCDFYGCNQMWQGIFIDAAAAPNGMQFVFFDGNIEDAYKGLTLDEANTSSIFSYQITNNTFRNNHIGITNFRQNGSALNASITQNTFWQSADLATPTGPMIPPPALLLDYPIAHAGVKYISTSTTIGANNNPNLPLLNKSNTFSCLKNGLISIAGSVSSVNNIFQNIKQFGIWADDGSMWARNCKFLIAGDIGIWAYGANLEAKSNFFGGDWVEGIHSEENLNAEVIGIFANIFTIFHNNWETGIYLSRSQASSGTTCTISGNIFTINSDPVGMFCIYVDDFVNATDKLMISINQITINSVENGIVGIFVFMGSSDNFTIVANTIHYSQISNYASWGIALFKNGLQTISEDNLLSYNTITGVPANFEIEENALNCGFHVAGGIRSTNFCENTVDQTRWGFHFVNNNTVSLRENYINHHGIGLYIVSGGIGLQSGRGNQWNLDPDACVHYAAKNESAIPLFSQFLVDEVNEGIVLPWLPPSAKLFPVPNPSNPATYWFHKDTVDLDHCVLSEPPPSPRQLTPYENEAVAGTSVLSGAALWDLKRELYAKLLIFPELRPTGSPEAVFFNSLSNTTIADYGQVAQQVRSALNLSGAHQSAFDSYRAAIAQAFENLAALDENFDYDSSNNLTNSWLAQRALLIYQVSVYSASEAALENTRNQPMNTGFQNALAYNGGIVATLPYETARKTLNELHIRYLLAQPITQALYIQALYLAQEDAADTGYATEEAVSFLAHCDQALYLDKDEGGHERGEGDQNHKIADMAILQISPNPTTGFIEVSLPYDHGSSLAVYNANGQKIKTLSVAAGSLKVPLDLGQNAVGLYWVILSDKAGKTIGTAKISVTH